MKKIISLVILLTTLMLGATGCARSLVAREEEEKEAMLEYMYDKYGVEFQVDSSTIKMTTRSYIFRCSLKGTTNEDEKAQITVYKHTDNREEPYEDTYFPMLICDDIEERVIQELDGKIEPYKAYVYANLTCFVNNKYREGEQLDQYLEEYGDKSIAYSIAVFVLDQGTNEENKELAQEILDILKESDIGNAGIAILCLEENVYAERTRDNSRAPLRNADGTNAYVYRYAGEIYDEF